MASAALEDWRGYRAELLDQLFGSHEAMGGAGAGRRWATDELNRALLLRVASQFQGFARDLHVEVAITFGSLAQPTNETLARVIATGLQTKRELDRVNAQEDSLASDFGRFGIVPWDELQAHYVRTAGRRAHLRWFNAARNALAHDDQAALKKVLEAGYPIDLRHVRQWRSTLNGLAGTMDAVMAVTSPDCSISRDPGKTMDSYRQGESVIVPWGLDEVLGTVVYVFGPRSEPFVMVRVNLVDSAENADEAEVGFRAGDLRRPTAEAVL